MRVALGMDHWGFLWKEEIIAHRQKGGHEVGDKGAYHHDPSDDYPDYVEPVARAVASGEVERGIVVCGSGVGACITANKVFGVRAAVCHDTYSAHQGVEHDDMNVLAIGSRIVDMELARELLDAFLKARYSAEERHERRLNKVKAVEAANLRPADSSL